jgi:hypothetical protein
MNISLTCLLALLILPSQKIDVPAANGCQCDNGNEDFTGENGILTPMMKFKESL